MKEGAFAGKSAYYILHIELNRSHSGKDDDDDSGAPFSQPDVPTTLRIREGGESAMASLVVHRLPRPRNGARSVGETTTTTGA